MMPKAGSLGSLARESFDVSDLEVLDDMLLIQVECIGLNFADIFACQGLYSATPQGGFVPGLEFSGTVLKVGKSVTAHREGDRVMGVTRFGAFTTHLVCKAAFLRPLPAGWGFEEGSAFLCTALTAWYGLVKLGALAKDHTVLVHSAAGGVGLASLEIVAAHGARAIATIGSVSKAALLQDRMGLPAGSILVRAPTSSQFAAQLDKALASMPERVEGLDLVMDSIQGPYFQPAYDKLARGGRVVVFGAASMTPAGDKPNWLRLAWQWVRRPMVDPLEVIAANKGVLGFNLIWLWDKVEEIADMLEAMMLKVPWKKPFVGARYQMNQLPDAVRYLQSGQSVGKVIICVRQA